MSGFLLIYQKKNNNNNKQTLKQWTSVKLNMDFLE